MKQQAIQYLAFDVHQATVVATLRNERGDIVMRATVPTEAKAIMTLVKSAGPRVHVAFEEGTQAQWLHDLIVPLVERVIVCNVRGRSETTNKSDRIDADQLSELLRMGGLKPVYHGAPEVLNLKELVRNYNNLVEDTTRVMQRLKAMFRGRAIRTPGVSVYRPSQRKQWLAMIEGGARVRATSLLTQLDTLLDLRSKAKAAMIASARRQPGWKSLRSIPYLGVIRVAQILAIMRTPLPLPHETESLALRRLCRCDPIERRRGIQRREAPPAEEGPDYAGTEPQSQSHPQSGLQGSGECGHGQARPIA